MNYSINRTEEYHKKSITTLGWELTVCNAMEEEHTPIRKHLMKNQNYGKHLIDFMRLHLPMGNIKSIVEVGGGYGFLMREMIKSLSLNKAVLVDISERLLDIQKGHVSGSTIEFINQDVFTLNSEFYSEFDLAIFNENLGDFPTVENIDVNELLSARRMDDDYLKRMKYFLQEYDLPIENISTINFNIGAFEVLERVCRSGIPFVFMSEHSCEAGFNGRPENRSKGIPERIMLAGHNEYTIKFSYLEIIARKNNYNVARGPFADFIKYNESDELHYILKSHSMKDEHEIVRQFIEDIYKYEYILLKRIPI